MYQLSVNQQKRRRFIVAKKKKKAKKKSRKMIEVLWLNNDGGGYAERLRVSDGSTVDQLVAKKMGTTDSHNCTVNVNRDIASASQILRSGDRVSVTPKNVSGA